MKTQQRSEPACPSVPLDPLVGRDDVTPFVGMKIMAGPHRAIVVEHVDDTQVYYAIHDDRSRSYLPSRHRIRIAEWMRVASVEVAAGKATIAPNASLNGARTGA